MVLHLFVAPREHKTQQQNLKGEKVKVLFANKTNFYNIYYFMLVHYDSFLFNESLFM